MPSADSWERQIEIRGSKKVPNSSSTSNFSSGIQEPKQGELDNPAFIWPGSTARTISNQTYQPVRGYIRRLNEFYAKMGDASDIKNRRCNFQFQPESFERTVDGNAISTQFFFNQDPGQLTVPVPGQSSYTLRLMFNREAEVASGTYIPNTKGGSIKTSRRVTDPFDLNAAQRYMTSDYNKSWVCQIGVLADIFVLDSIIGQGINKETISTLQNIVDRNARNAKDNPPKDDEDDDADEQDKKTNIKTGNDYWSANAGSLKDNPNIGNTAFLVPSPVRIMLSNLMMIEGFVTQSSVNIHKFTNTFIPTQAVVTLQIQALYIGFAKKQTMLTSAGEGSSGDGEDVSAEPDLSNLSASQVASFTQIAEGTKGLYKKITHDENTVDILKIITPVNKTEHPFNFLLEISPAGKEFIDNNLDKAAGKAANFTWSGTIKMWWHSHVSSNGTRGFSSINAPAPYTLTAGAPSDSSLVKWGTERNPLTLAVGNGQMFEKYASFFQGGNVLTHIIGKVSNAYFSGQEDAKWSLYEDSTIDASIPRPYIEDRFNIELRIELKLEFDGTTYPVAQIAHVEKEVACGDDVLFKGITFTVPAP